MLSPIKMARHKSPESPLDIEVRRLVKTFQSDEKETARNASPYGSLSDCQVDGSEACPDQSHQEPEDHESDHAAKQIPGRQGGPRRS